MVFIKIIYYFSDWIWEPFFCSYFSSFLLPEDSADGFPTDMTVKPSDWQSCGISTDFRLYVAPLEDTDTVVESI